MKITARETGDAIRRGFTLLQMTILFVVLGLVIGGLLMGEEIAQLYRVHAQVAQLTQFDEAVAQFYGKFEGLPGDLLAVMADRQGLPAGDGTPGHGDSDGKISPCNLGWQWHLGCETALFWSHLSVTGMISENFSADSRFTNDRLEHVGAMDPYLPRSPLAENIYIAVWNSDSSQPSPQPRMRYGNYYEISGIRGVNKEKMLDNPKALTPIQAQAIDEKMDDGDPRDGRVLVNGNADWPADAWGTLAKTGPKNCVAHNNNYNTAYFLYARSPLCHLAVRMECCKK